VPTLLTLKGHRGDPVRLAVYTACAELHDQRAVEPLIKQWQGDIFNGNRWRRQLVRLGPAGEKEIVRVLL
jgi:hypothetical protein